MSPDSPQSDERYPTGTEPENRRSPDDKRSLRQARPLAVVLALAGTFLIGLAIGLMVYSLATDVVTEVQQRSLSADAPGLLGSPGGAPALAGTPVMDFSGLTSSDVPWWRSRKSGQAMARIVIPRIGLNRMLVRGTERADLAKGPGWIVTSDPPGSSGNCAISGHRTTFGAPFFRINELKRGDTIRLITPFRAFTYKVEKVFLVTPDRVDVVSHTDEPVLTLTACHPRYSARQRIIVRASLYDVRRPVPKDGETRE